MDYSVNALVLRSIAVGDYDKSLTLLAEGEGLISCWAKSAARIKSPLLAASSVFTYGRYTLNKRGERITLRQAEVSEPFFDLRRDITVLAAAGFAAELCSSLAVAGQAENELLRLTLNALFALSKGITKSDAVVGAYTIRAMTNAGYMPHLDGCVKCGGTDTAYSFSSLDGGLVCRKCDSAAPQVPMAVIDAMRYTSTCEDKKLYSFKADDDFIKDFSEIASDFASNQLAKPFESYTFYKSIAQEINK